MKKISSLFLVTFLLSILISSCSDRETYAEQLQAEKKLIAAYIKRNNIRVLSSFPKGTWGENDYVLTSSGLYFHLVDSGDVKGEEIKEGDEVIPRYIQYALDKPDTVFNWTTEDNPYPSTFIYYKNSSETTCIAFHEAVSYLKWNNAWAKIIVPSKIGLNPNDLTSATPYGYDLKIQIYK